MAGKSLEDAVQKMINNIEIVAETTGHLVNQKMKTDFENMAKGTVDKYYEYKNGYYTKYGRQYNLYNIYKVTTSLKKTKKSINLEVNLNMDYDMLEGLYHSNSSDVWENVEAKYVFDNFMAGLHPWTNGWPQSSAKTLKYKLIQGSPKVQQTIKKYKKSYGDTYFNKYVDTILIQLLKIYL